MVSRRWSSPGRVGAGPDAHQALHRWSSVTGRSASARGARRGQYVRTLTAPARIAAPPSRRRGGPGGAGRGAGDHDPRDRCRMADSTWSCSTSARATRSWSWLPRGATLLIDGGPDPDVTLRRLGSALPWWRRAIDVVHPHPPAPGPRRRAAGRSLRRFRVATVLDGGRGYPNPPMHRFLALARATSPATATGRPAPATHPARPADRAGDPVPRPPPMSPAAARGRHQQRVGRRAAALRSISAPC